MLTWLAPVARPAVGQTAAPAAQPILAARPGTGGFLRAGRVAGAGADRLHLEGPDGSRLPLVPVSPTRFRAVGMLGSYLTVELERRQVRSARFERPGSAPLRLLPTRDP